MDIGYPEDRDEAERRLQDAESVEQPASADD